MSPGIQILLSGAMSFGIPLALAAHELVVLRRRGDGYWRPGEPPASPAPKPLSWQPSLPPHRIRGGYPVPTDPATGGPVRQHELA